MERVKSWDEVQKKLFSEEEIQRSRAKVKLILRIIKERKRQGFSQRDLANKAGITQSTLASIETLDANPTLDTLLKLTNALGLELLPERQVVTTHYSVHTPRKIYPSDRDDQYKNQGMLSTKTGAPA